MPSASRVIRRAGSGTRPPAGRSPGCSRSSPSRPARSRAAPPGACRRAARPRRGPGRRPGPPARSRARRGQRPWTSAVIWPHEASSASNVDLRPGRDAEDRRDARVPGQVELIATDVERASAHADSFISGSHFQPAAAPPPGAELDVRRRRLAAIVTLRAAVPERAAPGPPPGPGGSSPRGRSRRRRPRPGSRRAARGCRGDAGRRRARRPGPSSTISPRYITATRSAMWWTTARSWAMNR